LFVLNKRRKMRKKINLISTIICVIISCFAISSSSAFATKQQLNSEQVKSQQIAQMEEGIYVLVSFSMNDAALRKYFIEAQCLGAKLVEHLNVKQVPVIAVVSKDKKHGKMVKQISGHISLHKALEMMEVDVKQDTAL